jgi:ketosteroid isomerase-like protein
MSAACAGSGEDGDAAAGTARALFAAVAAGDGEAACATLAPDTVAELEESSGTACAQAITEEDLPEPGTVETVDVYGQWARVVTSNDTVFLGAFGDGWRVVAAGCRSRGERPYDCRLQGE